MSLSLATDVIDLFKEPAICFIDFSLLSFRSRFYYFLLSLFPTFCLLWVHFALLFLVSDGGSLYYSFENFALVFCKHEIYTFPSDHNIICAHKC